MLAPADWSHVPWKKLTPLAMKSAEDAGPGRAARDVAEEARVVVMTRELDHVRLEAPQDLVELGRGVGRRLAQARLHLRPGGAAPRARLVQGRDPLDQQVDDLVAELAHPLWVELELALLDGRVDIGHFAPFRLRRMSWKSWNVS